MAKVKRKLFSFHTDKITDKRLTYLAKKDEQSKAQVIREAVREQYERRFNA